MPKQNKNRKSALPMAAGRRSIGRAFYMSIVTHKGEERNII